MASHRRTFRPTDVTGRRLVAALVAVFALGTAAATASSVTTGRYVGSTSQGVPASLTVAGGRVRQATVHWTAHCTTGHQTVHNTTTFSNVAISGQRFTIHGSTSAPVATGYRARFTDTAQGTISGARITGTFQGVMRVYRIGSARLADTCASGTVHFSLRRG